MGDNGNDSTLWRQSQLHPSRSSVRNEANKNKVTSRYVTKEKTLAQTGANRTTCFCLKNKAKKRKSI